MENKTAIGNKSSLIWGSVGIIVFVVFVVLDFASIHAIAVEADANRKDCAPMDSAESEYGLRLKAVDAELDRRLISQDEAAELKRGIRHTYIQSLLKLEPTTFAGRSNLYFVLKRDISLDKRDLEGQSAKAKAKALFDSFSEEERERVLPSSSLRSTPYYVGPGEL